MKTPGSLATKLKVFDLPGCTSTKATFGAIRAAWKSTECGIGELFVSVTLTSLALATWIDRAGRRVAERPGLVLDAGCDLHRRRAASSRCTRRRTAPGGAPAARPGSATCAVGQRVRVRRRVPAKLGVAVEPAGCRGRRRPASWRASASSSTPAPAVASRRPRCASSRACGRTSTTDADDRHDARRRSRARRRATLKTDAGVVALRRGRVLGVIVDMPSQEPFPCFFVTMVIGKIRARALRAGPAIPLAGFCLFGPPAAAAKRGQYDDEKLERNEAVAPGPRRRAPSADRRRAPRRRPTASTPPSSRRRASASTRTRSRWHLGILARRRPRRLAARRRARRPGPPAHRVHAPASRPRGARARGVPAARDDARRLARPGIRRPAAPSPTGERVGALPRGAARCRSPSSPTSEATAEVAASSTSRDSSPRRPARDPHAPLPVPRPGRVPAADRLRRPPRPDRRRARRARLGAHEQLDVFVEPDLCIARLG